MYKRRLQGWARHLDLFIIDLIWLHVSFFGAYVLRHGFVNFYSNRLYLSMGLIMLLLNTVYITILDPFRNILTRSTFVEVKEAIKQTIYIVLLSSLVMFFTQEGIAFSRITLLMTALIYFIGILIIRTIWKNYRLRHKDSSHNPTMLLLSSKKIIKSSTMKDLLQEYKDYNIKGFVVLDSEMIIGGVYHNVPIVATHQNMIDYISKQWVDEVMIYMPAEKSVPVSLINTFVEMGVTVHYCLGKIGKVDGQSQFVESIGNYTFITTSINTIRTSQWLIKRVFDIIVGIIGCVFTLLITIIIGPIIFIESPGPIFFKQQRVGRNGKPFYMYKFRSMYLNAEEEKEKLMEQNTIKDGMMFKIDFDPRIIGSKKLPDGTCKKGIGNYIRDYSIDEFPQFLNVLRGDMSFIGTRPPTIDEWNKYELHHRARLAFKPGITGLWQVSGRSNIKDFEEVVKLDKEYIENWGIELDAKILIKTFIVVFKKEGSM